MTEQIRKKLAHVPDKPGAYMMNDEAGEVIYVGKAASLRNRVRSYFRKGQTQGARVMSMVSKVRDVEWMVTDSEIEALMLECNLIKKHRPYYNVRLRDDKHYPYLCLTTTEPFPRITITRKSKEDGNRYFGPFTDSAALRETTRLIRRAFKIRSCNKKLTGRERDRPCLNLHLSQCLSPCSGMVSTEEYADLVRDTGLFLEGRQETLMRELESRMRGASDALEFERAARLRDQVEAVRRVVERQKVINTETVDQDIVSLVSQGGTACVQIMFIRAGRLVGQDTFFMGGVMDDAAETSLSEFLKQYYRDAPYVPEEVLLSHDPSDRRIIEEWLRLKRGRAVHLFHPKRGEKRRLVELAQTNASLTAQRELEHLTRVEAERLERLDALRQVLEMERLPIRIEAYDISNLQGREAVGSMVVFEEGAPAKSQYRRFKIRTVDQANDYEMLRETLRRRLSRAASGAPKFSVIPDLIVVDGGKGQLSVARDVIARSGLGIPAVGLAKRLEEIYRAGGSEPVLLPADSKALLLLQQIRDEAHRFALAYHHKVREKQSRKSILDGIPGVGPKRRKALIKRFGSVAGIRKASVESLLEVPGITRGIAEAIADQFNNNQE